MMKIAALNRFQTRNAAIIKRLCFLTLLAAIGVSGQETAEHLQIQLGEISQTYQLGDQGIKFFQLSINKEYLQKDDSRDILIKVFSPPDQPFGDPNLYISKSNPNPISVETSDFLCSTQGKDICVIPNRSQNNTNLWFLGVRCYQACHFNLYAQMKEPIELEDGKELQVPFGTQETKLFKMWIPESTIGESQVSGITIEASSVGQERDGEEGMLMTAATKYSKPTTASKRAVPGWRHGLSLRISETVNKDDWCNECWVHILLDVQQRGIYRIKARSNQGIQRIKSGIKIDDTAFFGDNKICYKYFIDNSQDDVIIKVAQYSGLINFNFNPRTQASTLVQAPYHSKDTQNTILTISADQRKENPIGEHYLCVYPLVTSTYSIVIHQLPPYRLYELVEDSYTEHSEILGQAAKFFLYKVPLLDYKTEDLKIEFKLTTVSGSQAPNMRAKFLTEDYQKVTETKDMMLRELQSFMTINASQAGKDLDMIIDHNETLCLQKFKGISCYYLIEVQGSKYQNASAYTKFTLTVSHSQKNHHILQENTILSETVDKMKYKYYSFTLNDGKGVRNLTFHMDSVHGDADLYISKYDKFPTKVDYERRSVKSLSSMPDEIIYSPQQSEQSDQNSLEGTYFIGIYASQYSQFNLLVKVQRKFDSNQQQSEQFKAVNMIEGLPIQGNLGGGVEGTDYFKFDVRFAEGFEKSIKIQVHQEIGNWAKMYVKTGSTFQGKKDYQWESWDGQVEIKTSDSGYVKEGTYWVKVVATTNYWQSLVNINFRYSISYSSQDNFAYLRSNIPIQLKTKSLQNQALRHYVTSQDQGLSISLSVFSGNPQLFLSANPHIKMPSRVTHDFTTMNSQSGLLSGRSRSISISKKQLEQLNPYCNNNLDNLDNSEPCAIYGTVYCFSTEDCSYTLTLSYDTQNLQGLKFGVPIQGSIKNQQFNYYYVTLNDGHNKSQQGDILAILISQSIGKNAQLFISMQENPQKSEPEDWIKPTLTEYSFLSTEGSQDQEILIRIKQIQLQTCFGQFDRGDLLNYHGRRSCGLVLGVYYPRLRSDPNQDFQDLQYKLLIYQNLVQLQSHSSFNANVEQDDFQYYRIESTCDNCTLLIGLQTFYSGDPDLYITFGDQEMPTKSRYDFRASTFRSELVYINLKNPFFIKNNITSMRGPYMVGVYGTKKSNYTITFTQEKYPLGVLTHQRPLKGSQEPFEIVYFMWYNQNKNKDVKIQFTVKKGFADIYINTYDERVSHENLADLLPYSKNKAYYILENISPMTSVTNQTLLISNQQQGYCSECFYLIGVVSHEFQVDYTIMIESLDFDFKSFSFIKIGQLYRSSLAPGEKRSYKFIMEDHSDLTLMQTMSEEATVSTYLKIEKFGQPILKLQDTDSQIVKKSDSLNFKLGLVYYIDIQNGQIPGEFSIQLNQERTILHLSDGMPTKLIYNGPQDIHKFFAINIPGPTYDSQDPLTVTVNVVVKTFTENFHPQLFVQLVQDLDTQVSTMEFPPGGISSDFEECFNWDFRLEIMLCTFTFEVQSRTAGLAINLFEPPIMRRDRAKEKDLRPEVQLTVSTTSQLKLLPGQIMIGELQSQYSTLVYSVDQNLLKNQTGGYLMLEFSQCRGETDLILLENYHPSKNLTKIKSVEIIQRHSEFGRDNYFIQLPLKNLEIFAKPRVISNIPDNDETQGLPYNSFILTTRHNQRDRIKNNQFYIKGNGKINFEVSDDFKQLKLTWGSVHYTNVHLVYKELTNVEYIVVLTTDQNAHLESQCAITLNAADQYRLHNFFARNNSFDYPIVDPDQTYYLNIFAKVKPEGQLEYDYLPYKPLVVTPSLYAASSNSQSSLLLLRKSKLIKPLKTMQIVSMLVIVIVLISIIVYFRRKTQGIQERLEFEMTTVRHRQGNDDRQQQHVELAEGQEDNENQDEEITSQRKIINGGAEKRKNANRD